MNTIIGHENTRVLTFGKRHRVSVTFTRRDGLWRAHSALLPTPCRSIQEARQIVAKRLASIASEAAA